MLDLKTYAGEHVLVQFRQGDAWLMSRATMTDGQPDIGFVTKTGPDGASAVPTVFIHALVNEAGRLVPEGAGIEVEINPDAIFTITRVQPNWTPPQAPAAPSRIVRP